MSKPKQKRDSRAGKQDKPAGLGSNNPLRSRVQRKVRKKRTGGSK